MTTLDFKDYTYKVSSLNGESSLPSIADMVNVQHKSRSKLDEDDGLFIGYGFIGGIFPYRMQDMYDRELKDTVLKTAVLENEFLRAEFLPDYGGRLWSLYDKKAGKELLFKNPVIRPGNLAVRNAWLSGGVEWNCGMVGHHPFTCSRIFTAVTKLSDGTPVLRMYEFERVRRCVYQMDFFLPDKSPVLYARMRIVNPNPEVVPMYWWSNIAVPELKDGRVIMDSVDAYSGLECGVAKVPVPIFRNYDITYPTNNPSAIDFFWHVPEGKRKYECQLNGDGYGLIQSSTRRLKGRKLFVWGQGPGGDRWQEYLSLEGTGGRYVEIQAGIANTQYECLPMPPKTAWEWLESYGAIQCDGEKVHGDWKLAREEVSAKLNGIVTEEYMEKLLADTHEMAVSPASETMLTGSGWGFLENYRRKNSGEDCVCPHLDFGSGTSAQKQWLSLLDKGYMEEQCADSVPESWMLQEEWTSLLEKAVRSADMYNWYTWLQLGVTYYALGRYDDSYNALEKSLSLRQSCWALYALSNVVRVKGERERGAMLALRAAMMKPDDISLAKEAMKLMISTKLYRQAINFAVNLPEKTASIGRIKLNLALAYVETGDIESAEAIIYEGGSISVADIREGENTVTELWYKIEEAKAKLDGRAFDRDSAVPPAMLDFRMNAVKK